MKDLAYIRQVKERLTRQGFTPVEMEADLAEQVAVVLEREEPWGRLLVALAGRLNLTDAEGQERVAAAAAAWVRTRPPGSHLLLLFPFDRRVEDGESGAIRRLRQEGPEGRWSVIPWTADLEVGLLDRHTGFPPVPDPVVRALTEVDRGPAPVRPPWAVRPGAGGGRLGISLEEVPVTRVILASTFAYYIWSVMMAQAGHLLAGVSRVITGPDLYTLMRWGANHGLMVFRDGEQWRLLTHVLLHGGLMHLGLNMWALWSLGRHTELIYGPSRMAFIYLVAGVAGGIGSTAFRPGYIPSVGASGAIFGLLGALIYWGQSFRDRPVNWHGLWGPVVANLVLGLFLPFIDNHAHIGGLVGGALAGFIAGAPGERQAWRSWAMGLVSLLILLLLAGLIRLPHLAAG
ncbi:MAG: rhomboid family intramembrane serine protease [Bacillota bacterium]